jgi:hypothetical protein
VTEREQHRREQLIRIRRLCEDRVWGEGAFRARNVQLMASVPTLLDWLVEELDESAELRRLVDKALVLTHIVGANGGMTDKDHVTEADIRHKAGVG